MLTAEAPAKANGAAPAKRAMKWEELAQHNHAGSLFVAVRGKVYDVTDFAQRHPGACSESHGQRISG